MIYIVGIDHPSHQTETYWHKEEVFDLLDVLRELTTNHKIALIAEECSKQALEVHEVEKTPAQEFAENAAISHLLADPDSNERSALGIRSRKDTADMLGIDIFSASELERAEINKAHKEVDVLREREWLNRIKDHRDNDVIFLCGFEHVESFKSVLEEAGIAATIHKVLDH